MVCCFRFFVLDLFWTGVCWCCLRKLFGFFFLCWLLIVLLCGFCWRFCYEIVLWLWFVDCIVDFYVDFAVCFVLLLYCRGGICVWTGVCPSVGVSSTSDMAPLLEFLGSFLWDQSTREQRNWDWEQGHGSWHGSEHGYFDSSFINPSWFRFGIETSS